MSLNSNICLVFLAHGDAPSSHVTNPSIGEVSLGASLSLGSACHLDERGHGGGGCGGGDGSSAVLTGVGGTRDGIQYNQFGPKISQLAFSFN